MVAEVAMPAGAGPAAGEGFNDLAGYIFGGNNRCWSAATDQCRPHVFSLTAIAAVARVKHTPEGDKH